MEKVKLPREVTKAIDTLMKNGWEEGAIIREMFPPTDAGSELRIIHDFAYGGGNNFMDLLKSLVNSYELEGSLEDKVRQYYERLKKEHENWEKVSRFLHSGNPHSDEMQGVSKTLYLLNIKIEGVNA